MITKIRYDYPPDSAFTSRMEHIENIVCQYFGVTIEQVKSPCRARINKVIQARHMIFYLAHNNTRLTVKYLAYRMGKRDHTTCLASVITTNNLLQTNDPETVNDYETIKSLLSFTVKPYQRRTQSRELCLQEF